ncbi:MAG: putative tyrosine recombinase XerC-like protein [Methanosaeta sp. PtaU1.Bin060]|nr:MAG: putative tyrosine recombinase XerC-like protein [Methanosaeta sp. PtaB.Bin039]OPY54492.1 MAG: putative tyrosine recombinase XerC-like protein [Methanosaeta sp. PtaU1.Bin060]
MDSLMERFLQDCNTRGMSPRTLPGYKSALKMFDLYLNQRGIEVLAVDRDVLRRFLEHSRGRGLSPRTIELFFSVLSSFYEYLAYEGMVSANPVLVVRKRYLRRYKDNGDGHERQLISVDDMARLINSEIDIRNRAIIALLAKTGMRRNELMSLDASDFDQVENKIRLKPTPKRTNRTLFIDDETAFILRRWLRVREGMNRKRSPALFISTHGNRISRNDVYQVVVKAAKRVGLHDPKSDRMEDRFSPHCCRHWFTTHLRRAGMRREFIQELRGDARREAIDIYDHIDLMELKEAYLACIPQLGI